MSRDEPQRVEARRLKILREGSATIIVHVQSWDATTEKSFKADLPPGSEGVYSVC
jgi:hypothetical protein